jgi:acetyltransferase-like isoleucine patch superfamily enzyme
MFRVWRSNLSFRLIERAHRWLSVGEKVELGRGVHIGFGSTLWALDRLTVGDGVYIGRYCTIMCDGSIGAGTLIANNVGLVGRYDHEYRRLGVPMSRAPWIGDQDYRGPGRQLKVEIGEDVWLGYGAIVVSGVRVGRGAIVAAGAVVTDDVEPYAVVAGDSARPVGERFSSEDRVEHERRLAAGRRAPG